MKAYSYLIFLALLAPLFASAQSAEFAEPTAEPVSTKSRFPKFELGIGLQGMVYQGDLMPDLKDLSTLDQSVYSLRSTRPAAVLSIRHNTHRLLSLRGQLTIGQLLADERKHFLQSTGRANRGFRFETPVIEGALVAEVHPLGKTLFSKKYKNFEIQRTFSPYLLVGAGAAYAKAKTNFNLNGDATMQPRITADQQAKYNRTRFVAPFGIGVRVNVSDSWAIGLETMLRPVFDDYLDGVSQAGNPKQNDWFLTSGINLVFRLQKPDRDRDGIADLDDRCPNEAGKPHLQGCPDGDFDGVADEDDQCPTVTGIAALNGCPDTGNALEDLDRDGISDKDDLCPEKPGTKKNQGCPTSADVAAAEDRDQDGVADKFDLCPDKPGIKRWNGCPDTDGDGVPDNRDACLNDPGIVDLGGCPDKDRDGVRDIDDLCPERPGVVVAKGCPETMQVPAPLARKVLYYEINAIKPAPAYVKLIDEVVALMRTNPQYHLRIEGHTDNTGAYPGNQILSEKRAQYCLDLLLARGGDVSRIHHAGLGDKRPANSNITYEGRNMNRRVELVFYQP